jgi:hypothetical protein
MATLLATSAMADEIKGKIVSIDQAKSQIVIHDAANERDVIVSLPSGASIKSTAEKRLLLKDLHEGASVSVADAVVASNLTVQDPDGTKSKKSMFQEFWYNFTHNLFKPLLLFFYLGFLVPILRVKLEFPYVVYQALVIYLLIAIGWKGGEELASLESKQFGSILTFMIVGFMTNFVIGILAYFLLSALATMRRIDKATVAGYYGSDSAGTFVTCLGVLSTANVNFDAYMPVMLAVMEIPGCLVALYLVSRLRSNGMDPIGNMPDEPGYNPKAAPILAAGVDDDHAGHSGHGSREPHPPADTKGFEEARELSLEKREGPTHYGPRPVGILSPKLLHEVFLNPGLYLLFGGILIGYVSRMQGKEVTRADDSFFVTLFQGVLCLFLLEMGMTASRKLRDLATAGPGYIIFGLFAPNLFATLGLIVSHAYSHFSGLHFEEGTYILFAVLCGAASYIAVPAVQRLAIPEASPTLPLAASLGLTFSYNVTVGIPIYMQISSIIGDYIKGS